MNDEKLIIFFWVNSITFGLQKPEIREFVNLKTKSVRESEVKVVLFGFQFI